MTQPSNKEVVFKKYIREAYRDHFEPFMRLHALAERSLGSFKGFVKNHYSAALVLIFPRAYKSYDSIRRLCEVALCEDAAVILRCLLNLLAVTRWLSRNPEVRAEKYLRWYWVEMYREAEESPNLYPAAHLSEIRTKYATFKSLFEYTDSKGQLRMAKQWYVPDVKSIFDMFKEVDMEKQYEEGHRPLSGVEHSDAMAYFAMVAASERSDDRRQLAIQSDLFIPHYLRNAFQYFGDIFRQCNKTISLADPQELEQTLKEGIDFYAGYMRSKGIPT